MTAITLVSAFLYMVFLAGLLLLVRKQISGIPELLLGGRRLRVRKRKREQAFSLVSHLDDVLAAVTGGRVKPSALITLTLGLGVLIFASSASVLGAARALLTALLFASVPYLALRLRLEKIRRKGSFEGEELISLLISQYWISSCNIFDTLEKSAASGGPIKVTGRLMSALLIELRATGNAEKIAAATNRFAYGIGTNWGRLLAYHIKAAALTGCDISLALEDLMVQLREARALAEERKRINGEAVRITVLLIPLLYAGTVFVSVAKLGLSPLEFLRNQFYTYEGLSLFAAMAFLFMLNLGLLQLIMNRKLDF
ncbi:MAG: hypothetical protein LBC58_07295 [Clostridiales Family XIII bacterium]|jgi:hypothetical protein|nr:hypothetical protein [Clostridiales Family XIII bacterium]